MVCLLGHKWNGCTCRQCGKVRDEHHVMQSCTCIVCGKAAHDFSNCRCSTCGEADMKSLYAVREDMIESINDITLLADIIRYPYNIPVMKAAIARRVRLIDDLTDQAALLKIVNSKDELFTNNSVSMRINFSEHAVRRITDPLVLAEIAKKHPNKTVRSNAADGLTDQKVLEWIARNDTDYNVRMTALVKLTDESLLADIALKDSSIIVCCRAAEKITDQSLLEKIVRDAAKNSMKVSVSALNRLDNQFVAADFIKNCDDSFTDTSVLRKITDEQLLLSIAREAESKSIRNKAIHSLGGYYCADCSAENLPLNDLSVSCVCSSCAAENHEYELRQKRMSLPNKAEQTDSYEECIRCGAVINYDTNIRFTDW